MNIFENYLSQINKIILDNKKILKLSSLENLDNVNLEVPPDHFNYDLSSNISLVLAKINKLNSPDFICEVAFTIKSAKSISCLSIRPC